MGDFECSNIGKLSPAYFLFTDDVENILDRYKEKRQIRKRAKAKEVEATQLVHTHLQKDDVWEQCFN